MAAAVLLFLLAACAPTSLDTWLALSRRGEERGFRARDFNVPPFRLAGFIKGAPGAARDLQVYLEGDGRAVVRGRVTEDPSPGTAQGCELALLDPAPAVLYLARIGQYQPTQTGASFQAYWSNKRLSEESVEAASRAIDAAKAESGAERIWLIGYSGGGGLALLLAERRRDVAGVVTVAGLLDTAWWVRTQRYAPSSLAGSLNPAERASVLADLPQLHFYGTGDSIIPPEMAGHFSQLASFKHLKLVPVKSSHWSAWTALWPELLRRYVLPLRAAH